MKVKLLAIGLLALLAFGLSERAEAKKANLGLCLKLYKGEYSHAAKYKAFATSNGGAPSSNFACGYSYGNASKAKAKAAAMKECKTRLVNGVRVKSCAIIDVQ